MIQEVVHGNIIKHAITIIIQTYNTKVKKKIVILFFFLNHVTIQKLSI